MKPSQPRDLFPGALEMMILRTLKRQPLHGYALVQHIKRMSDDLLQIEEGSLYPALHRLEDRGWLQAVWKESETGREAKFYSLTKKGRRQMDAEVAEWQRLCDAVGLFLRAPEGES